MPIEIYELERREEKEWDVYVLKHPNSTFFHQIGWRNVVQETYKHKPIYLVAKEDGNIKGILPLFLMKGVIFGTKLVSVPFAPYGGVCADDEMAEKMLIEEAIRVAEEYDVDYLELRTISGNNVKGFITQSLYVTSILKLDRNPDVVWNERLKRNKRKAIVKSEKRNLSIEWTDRVDDFYKIYASNMRDLGSPVHSKKFFENIIHEFPDESKVSVVKRDDVVIYAAFYLFFKDTVINSWSSTREEYRKYYPTDFGIWNVIKYCCERGYRYYDFGRSQVNSSNLEFKRRWSAETKPLYYQYYLKNAKEAPNFTSMNPKRQKFAGIWKKLPLKMTTAIGPLIRKKIP